MVGSGTRVMGGTGTWRSWWVTRGTCPGVTLSCMSEGCDTVADTVADTVVAVVDTVVTVVSAVVATVSHSGSVVCPTVSGMVSRSVRNGVTEDKGVP